MNEMKSHWYFQGSLCGLSVGENFFLYMEYLLTVCVAWGTTEKAHVFFQRRVGDSCFISAFIFVRTMGVDECDSVFFSLTGSNSARPVLEGFLLRST